MRHVFDIEINEEEIASSKCRQWVPLEDILRFRIIELLKLRIDDDVLTWYDVKWIKVNKVNMVNKCTYSLKIKYRVSVDVTKKEELWEDLVRVERLLLMRKQ